MRRVYYLVASSDFDESRRGFPYPYKIYLCFDPPCAGFQRGTGHYGQGGHIPLKTFSVEDEFVRGCAGGWLVPYVLRMLQGEDVQTEVLEEYRRHNGQDAEAEFWAVSPMVDANPAIEETSPEKDACVANIPTAYDFKDGCGNPTVPE